MLFDLVELDYLLGSCLVTSNLGIGGCRMLCIGRNSLHICLYWMFKCMKLSAGFFFAWTPLYLWLEWCSNFSITTVHFHVHWRYALWHLCFSAFFPHPLYNILMCYHLIQGNCRPLGKRFIKMSLPQPILKSLHKHFLVGLNNPDHRLIEVREIVPQIFRMTLINFEKADGGHLSKMMKQLLH